MGVAILQAVICADRKTRPSEKFHAAICHREMRTRLRKVSASRLRDPDMIDRDPDRLRKGCPGDLTQRKGTVGNFTIGLLTAVMCSNYRAENTFVRSSGKTERRNSSQRHKSCLESFSCRYNGTVMSRASLEAFNRSVVLAFHLPSRLPRVVPAINDLSVIIKPVYTAQLI